MAFLAPFRAVRPAPGVAAPVASVPYDVVNVEEARALAAGQPLSFLHVTRAEIDLPPGLNPYDPRVYDQAVRNFEDLKRAAPLLQDDEPSLYFYRLRMGAHEQVGLTGLFSLDEYDRGLIKKHEKTRKDKEDDRTRHMTALRAQTGVVFLTYRASAVVDAIARQVIATPPLYDFTATDGIAHTMWRVTGDQVRALVDAFASLPALYIADGHHRAASAARAREALPHSREATTFIATAFPDTAVRILAYNRTVKDLQTRTPSDLLAALGPMIAPGAAPAVPARRGDVQMFLEGRWHTLRLPPPPAGAPRDETLDVEILQRRVLEPILGLGDPRTDKRLDFVGGIRGTAELERLVSSGKAAVAFSLYPVTIEDLMVIADAGGIMPPKSTWFEPKLRDGLAVHLI